MRVAHTTISHRSNNIIGVMEADMDAAVDAEYITTAGVETIQD